MKKVVLAAATVALLLGGTVFAFGIPGVNADRADCPGKITCPLTGDEVCKDQCPLLDADRADCPGKVTCPLTGELVCKDRCPLEKADSDAADLPPCCRDAE